MPGNMTYDSLDVILRIGCAEARVHNLHLNAVRKRKYISIVHSHALSFCAVDRYG